MQQYSQRKRHAQLHMYVAQCTAAGVRCATSVQTGINMQPAGCGAKGRLPRIVRERGLQALHLAHDLVELALGGLELLLGLLVLALPLVALLLHTLELALDLLGTHVDLAKPAESVSVHPRACVGTYCSVDSR